MSKRRNLVIVRAGKSSLHHEWLDLPAKDRNWDIYISFYDPEAFTQQILGEGVYKHLAIGGKFDGIFASCAEFPDYQTYDYVWLPDDDIRTTGRTINKMFDLMVEYDLTLAQPSLSIDSYYSFVGLLQSDRYILRYTNFVEVMVPCMKVNFLARIMPYFVNSKSGAGFDKIWPKYINDAVTKLAVFDTISVHHTRPIGQYLVGKLKVQGISKWDEEETFYLLNDHTMPLRLQFHSAITRTGKIVKNKYVIGWRLYREFNKKRSEMIQIDKVNSRLFRMLKWHLIYPLGLDNIPTPHEKET